MEHKQPKTSISFDIEEWHLISDALRQMGLRMLFILDDMQSDGDKALDLAAKIDKKVASKSGVSS